MDKTVAIFFTLSVFVGSFDVGQCIYGRGSSDEDDSYSSYEDGQRSSTGLHGASRGTSGLRRGSSAVPAVVLQVTDPLSSSQRPYGTSGLQDRFPDASRFYVGPQSAFPSGQGYYGQARPLEGTLERPRYVLTSGSGEYGSTPVGLDSRPNVYGSNLYGGPLTGPSGYDRIPVGLYSRPIAYDNSLSGESLTGSRDYDRTPVGSYSRPELYNISPYGGSFTGPRDYDRTPVGLYSRPSAYDNSPYGGSLTGSRDYDNTSRGSVTGSSLYGDRQPGGIVSGVPPVTIGPYGGFTPTYTTPGEYERGSGLGGSGLFGGFPIFGGPFLG